MKNHWKGVPRRPKSETRLENAGDRGKVKRNETRSRGGRGGKNWKPQGPALVLPQKRGEKQFQQLKKVGGREREVKSVRKKESQKKKAPPDSWKRGNVLKRQRCPQKRNPDD